MEIGKTLRVKNRENWRSWLQKNHKKEKEIWLVFYTKASGKAFLPYNDALDEALCFGWIDSTVKKLKADSRAQRFTPRRQKSPVSELNKEKIRRLVKEGKMTPAGLAVAGSLNDKRSLPKDIIRELKKDNEVWNNFQKFSESYKRVRVSWIDSARIRPEEFHKRLRFFIKKTKLGKKFGQER